MSRKANAEAPAVGSRWTSFRWPHGAVARVMGTVEGWVVYRRKNAAPALLHVNQWRDAFVPALETRLKTKPKEDTQ